MRAPRLAARAVILKDNRLLLVNAWPGHTNTLWCAPGGGVERGASLPDNLKREVHEETGLSIEVGPPCLINEFYDPQGSFHQVEIFFRCTITAGTLDPDWTDPEGVVHSRRFFARDELRAIRLKPNSLPAVAWTDPTTQSLEHAVIYDPLEPILR